MKENSEHVSRETGHCVGESGHGEVSAHVGAYIKVGVGLLLLTLVTVGLSYVDFGSHSRNVVVGMFVATVKAGMVAAIFMHLKGERVTIWRFLVLTAIFVAGLFLLTLFAHVDPISETSHVVR